MTFKSGYFLGFGCLVVGAFDRAEGASRTAAAFERYPHAIVAFVVCQAVCWTLAPSLFHRAVPMDVAEGYAWGREWVLATYKHPALPALLLEISRLLTGAVGWPAYLLSQVFVVATFVIVFALGRDLLGQRRATAGTLLLAGVAYYAWPTVEFNHNVAQMPIWALLPLALWRAIEQRSMFWWLVFTAAATVGVYTKISSLLLIAILAVWMAWDGNGRQQLKTPGPWIAAALLALLSAPMAYWLIENNFAPLAYAAARSKGPQANLTFFFGELVLNLFGLVALLGLAQMLPFGRAQQSSTLPSEETDGDPPDRRAISFLLAVTLGPLLLAIVGALVSGGGLKSSWGGSMFNYAGLLAVALARAQPHAEALRRLSIAAVCIAVIAPLCYAAVVVAGPYNKGAPMRVNWPQSEISERLRATWLRETGVPLRIVGGGSWVSDLVALDGGREHISVLSGPSMASAPWITPERIAREGMLVVWDASWTIDPPHLVRPFLGQAEVREEIFRTGRWLAGRDLVIRYAVVPPAR